MRVGQGSRSFCFETFSVRRQKLPFSSSTIKKLQFGQSRTIKNRDERLDGKDEGESLFVFPQARATPSYF